MEKRHFFCILAGLCLTAAVCTLIPMAILLAVDPLQVLYRHDGEQRHFFSDPAYRNAGLIRRHLVEYRDKKSVIIGSSLFMNTLAVDMRRYAGLPDGLTLCVSGLTPRELTTVYRSLPAEGPLEHILVGLDPWKYFAEVPRSGNRLPAGLYTGTFTNKLKAMARFEIVAMAVRMLAGSEPVRDHEETICVMHRACAAHAYSKNAARLDELRAMSRDQAERCRAAASEPDPPHVGGLDALLACLLDTPPHITAHVLIAPVFAGGEFTAEFPYYRAGVMRLVRETAGRSNIRVYGFDDVAAITHNMANYSDTIHYGLGVNRYMLKAVGRGKHTLTPATAGPYLDRVLANRQDTAVYYDPEHTVSFEGPVNEEAFARYPDFPVGPDPLPLPE